MTAMSEETGFINLKVLQLIGAEYRNAVEKHGPRFGSLKAATRVLGSEFLEVVSAVAKNNIDGAHGVRREAAQVAAVCVKILEGLPPEPASDR
jgi:hypothetical protein